MKGSIDDQLDLNRRVLIVNRELSALAFCARVLHEADDPRNPLLERYRFLGIVASNIDEFFSVRVAPIIEQIEARVDRRGDDGRTPRELLAAVHDAARLLGEAQQASYERLSRELAAAGHQIVSWPKLDASERAALADRYQREVHPILTPIAIEHDQPLPFIGALGLSLLVQLADPDGSSDVELARINIPSFVGRVLLLPDGRILPIEELIRANVASLFPGRRILGTHLFRITRDTDIEAQGAGADNLLAAIEAELRLRRFGRVVRLEVEVSTPREIVAWLLSGLRLEPSALYVADGVVDLSIATAIAALPLPALSAAAWTPATPARIAGAPKAADGGADLFSVIAEGDLLVHHPYEDFDASVGRFFAQAAADPDVLSIRATLYRAGIEAGIPAHLIRAAEAGKEVVVLVEPKARFDEAANIEWGRRLEEAGAHVAYGVMGLKTHCKATLVVRREWGELRRYVHLGTGNYNPATARTYTDLGLFTADREIGADVGNLFNALTGRSLHPRYRRLLVAPLDLRVGIEQRIGAATAAAAEGRHASIAIKVNALVDPTMIARLDRAATAGVEVDLIVRGACGLLPDPARHAGRMRIRSIVGELLEHSRIYRIEIDGQVEWLAGSADLMERNLDRRVEVLFPLRDATVRARAEEIMRALLADTRNAWSLQSDGAWLRVEQLSTDATVPRPHSGFAELKAAALGRPHSDA